MRYLGEESPVHAKICVLLERWIGVRLGKEEQEEETGRGNGSAGVSDVRGRRSTVEASVHVSRLFWEGQRALSGRGSLVMSDDWNVCPFLFLFRSVLSLFSRGCLCPMTIKMP